MSDITKPENSKKPIIIGIAGASGSGKSTLAKELATHLDAYSVTSLSTDRFFKKPLPKMVSPVTGAEHDDWNCADSLDYQRFIDALNEAMAGPDCEIIIIEGLTVLYFEEIRKLLHLKIFIELATEIRMYRRIKRNIERRNVTLEGEVNQFIDSAAFSERQYLLPTKIYADIIFNGYELTKMAPTIVSSYIKSLMD